MEFPDRPGRCGETARGNNDVAGLGQTVGHVADVAVDAEGFLEQDDARVRPGGGGKRGVGVELGVVVGGGQGNGVGVAHRRVWLVGR
nr:hypothetical protein [Hymenobacter cellulosilyticus]